MTRKQIGPTVIQDIALNLVFSVMGERRINRAQQEYADIAAKLPPLKVLSFKVNQLLQSIHQGALAVRYRCRNYADLRLAINDGITKIIRKKSRGRPCELHWKFPVCVDLVANGLSLCDF